MKHKQTLSRVVTATLLLAVFLFQVTWALAGTTGGLTGTVTDTNGVPIAGATVSASSPSQEASTTTDSKGEFRFLSLAPDTYTVSVSKDQYHPASVAGIAIFADNNASTSVSLVSVLKTIAHTNSVAPSSLIKSSVGGDIYSVNGTQMTAATALGGGGELNNAYSAIASVPGLVVGTGGMGWNQAVVVRGNNAFFTGFEYDGVPVNRSFDNYNSSTESNLGLQELQVYTGGGPTSVASTGTSGFVNQVIKTGTYPGYATLSGGLGTDAFYHQLKVEAGGASPDRNFSYYVGVSGYDQQYRVIDNNNGAGYMTPGAVFDVYAPLFTSFTGNGVYGLCGAGGSHSPLQAGCLASTNGLFGSNSAIADRESVANFHFGMPRKDGQKDDFQLLFSNSMMRSDTYTSINDTGGVGAYTLANTFAPYSATNYPHYDDAVVYNLPFGTNVDPGGTPLPTSYYYQPNSPTNRGFFAPLPTNAQDGTFNDVGTVKAQWTHPFNDRSFIRAYAYSMFTDWTLDGPNSAYGYDQGYYDGVAPNYNLDTHTAGGQLMYVNQINDKNLLQLAGNYTTANVVRFNNTGYISPAYACPSAPVSAVISCLGADGIGTSPIGLISRTNGVYTCYSSTTGAPVPCYSGAYKSSAASVAAGNALPIPAGAPAGAYWATLWNGNASGTYNQVQPKFSNAAFSDEIHPSDKLMINASVRYDNFQFDLPSANNGQNPFYAQIVQNYTCYSPTLGTLVSPLTPGINPPAPVEYVNGSCPTGYAHPNGTMQAGVFGPSFNLNVPSAYTMHYWEPRLSATYTQSPDTVWRASAGRYAEPPLTAAVDYVYAGGSAANLWGNFMNAGFFSPFHAIPGQTSGQYDLSLEHHIHGTALSYKITPFYGTTSNWEQQAFIGAGFVTQVPVGRAKNYGVESALSLGDFNKNGLSGALTFTYTQSLVQYQNLAGNNQIATANQAIENFNAMTGAGGGPKCFDSGTKTSAGFNQADPTCANPTTDILNPYYGLAEQGLQDVNGWYPQGSTALAPAGVNPSAGSWYNSPYVASLILNYRKDKLAITPSLQFQAGARYGGPYDIVGMDPRVCGANSASTGVTTLSPSTPAQQCDVTTYTSAVGAAPGFGYLYIPNPQTGSFATNGQYTEPNIVVANLAASYDLGPKVTATLTATSLFHTCFGGSKEPWSNAYSPGSVYCGYSANSLYASNFYNGTSANDSAANGVTPYPWETQSYLPKPNNSIGTYLPFNVYLNFSVKL
jgi:hypothetical protein